MEVEGSAHNSTLYYRVATQSSPIPELMRTSTTTPPTPYTYMAPMDWRLQLLHGGHLLLLLQLMVVGEVVHISSKIIVLTIVLQVTMIEAVVM